MINGLMHRQPEKKNASGTILQWWGHKKEIKQISLNCYNFLCRICRHVFKYQIPELLVATLFWRSGRQLAKSYRRVIRVTQTGLHVLSVH